MPSPCLDIGLQADRTWQWVIEGIGFQTTTNTNMPHTQIGERHCAWAHGPWDRAHGPWDRAHEPMGPGPWAHGTGPMRPWDWARVPWDWAHVPMGPGPCAHGTGPMGPWDRARGPGTGPEPKIGAGSRDRTHIISIWFSYVCLHDFHMLFIF